MFKNKKSMISPELLKNPSNSEKEQNQKAILCDNLNFAGAEAYKMLRTNLMFSLPDEKRCRIVGVTSAISGEGKSITSVNIAYTFAETGKKVLLIEADMRRSNIARKLQLKVSPGLSNLLAGLADGVIQQSKQNANLYVIAAGDVPPNPAELLSSSRMKSCLEALSQRFDFIFIDLPPVNIVTDAVSISRIVDGFIFVVRQDYSTRLAVTSAINQLKLVDAKILGFVMNAGSNRLKSKYYKNKYSYEANTASKKLKIHIEDTTKKDDSKDA